MCDRVGEGLDGAITGTGTVSRSEERGYIQCVSVGAGEEMVGSTHWSQYPGLELCDVCILTQDVSQCPPHKVCLLVCGESLTVVLTAGILLVGEEEPVSLLETCELFGEQTGEGGTHQSTW